MDIPQTGEASDYLRGVRSRDDNVEVDDWLCGETRNYGAPDVLDPQHKVAQRRLHSRSEHGEAIRPRRVILADDVRFLSHIFEAVASIWFNGSYHTTTNQTMSEATHGRRYTGAARGAAG